jgi:hydroxyacylglutathione hydrolase
MLEWILLGGAALAGLLFARFHYGLKLSDIQYWAYTKTFIGSMIHQTALAKYKDQPAHSLPSNHDCGTFLVRTVPFLADNYSYLIIDKESGRMAAVDVGDAQAVLKQVAEIKKAWDSVHRDRGVSTGVTDFSDGAEGQEAQSIEQKDAAPPSAALVALFGQVKMRPELTTVLTTHYHQDHCGGNAELFKACNSELRIVASGKEKVPLTTSVANHGARFYVGKTEVDVFLTPCHTKGHLCFYAHGPASSSASTPSEGSPAVNGALFSGDLLFTGGCGKFFEGDASMLHHALYSLLRPIPAATTLLFGGHEYTVGNLQFALWASERGNKAVEEKLTWALKRRSERRSTVPSLLSEEKSYNPFYRSHVPTLRARVAELVQDSRGKEMGEIPCLAALRRLKDNNAHLAKNALGASAGLLAGAAAASAASSKASKDEESGHNAHDEEDEHVGAANPFVSSSLDDSGVGRRPYQDSAEGGKGGNAGDSAHDDEEGAEAKLLDV